MSSYRVEIERRAWDSIMALPDATQESIFLAIEGLEQLPRPAKSKKLTGTSHGKFPEYRIRVGDYRILYEIHDNVLMVLVVKVGNRREVYKRRK